VKLLATRRGQVLEPHNPLEEAAAATSAALSYPNGRINTQTGSGTGQDHPPRCGERSGLGSTPLRDRTDFDDCLGDFVQRY